MWKRWNGWKRPVSDSLQTQRMGSWPAPRMMLLTGSLTRSEYAVGRIYMGLTRIFRDMDNLSDSLIDGQPEGIVLWRENGADGEEEEGWWIIRHERTGVTTQGETRLHALLMLADALAAYTDADEDCLELAEDVFTPEDFDQLE